MNTQLQQETIAVDEAQLPASERMKLEQKH